MQTGYDEILTDEAIQFVADIVREFSETRDKLLERRVKRQAEIDSGKMPDFLPETKEIREEDWTIAPLPEDLLDRRVEITGPAGDRKMVINAFNSGAKMFMADFEDSNSPTWENSIQGQINLRDANKRTIRFENDKGKVYELKEQTAVLIVRPRGWHLEEKHMLVDGKPVPAGLFDFGLYFFHNVKTLLANRTGPYFYLPKMESHLEARLWNAVFVFAQEKLNIPQGTIKATVLIETIMASFEMHEILYELRDHSAGLNCGRWDYIFSYIKRLKKNEEIILPDRQLVTMTVPFMRAYTQLTIQTCHKRNAPAIGGMAAQIPIRNDEEKNQAAIDKVRQDKEIEAQNGHDGTWVAHPGLVPVAMEVFDRLMPTSNQIDRKREDVQVSAADLIAVPQGEITEQGLRTNVRVGILYMEAWLRGFGAVAIDHLMEDAATAEISRAQIWQWIRHPKGILADGRKVDIPLFETIKDEELTKIKAEIGTEQFENGKFTEAVALFEELILQDEFEEFLTVPGYNQL
ncbi:malate synthase A [Hazenella sp. IB182357]|uniref:Malate synthase n=2 Tax=Polycladospora coralii TaxID=2771432 RepID=A0A926RT90_9BACL|nr:malate synthase A [Polycladospora coralii]MBD1372525.1 malate synthase A [Polycladospora coralii]MBS7531352.1 malate synthase A [Polycladospora coralii]